MSDPVKKFPMAHLELCRMRLMRTLENITKDIAKLESSRHRITADLFVVTEELKARNTRKALAIEAFNSIVSDMGGVPKDGEP